MCVSHKIKTVQEIGELLKERGQKKVVLCHGEFDLLHFGHTRYFKAARKFGDLLVVTLTPDRFIAKGPGRPVFNEDQRAEAIANLAFVDYVAVNEWPTAIETLENIRPDVYAKGSEYLNKVDVTGRLQAEKDKVESLGGKMEFTHEIIFSSSKLLNNNFEVFSKESKPFLSELAQSTKDTEVLELLASFAQKKVLVLGEFGLEEINILGGGEPSKLKERFTQAQGALLGLQALALYVDQLDFLSLGAEDQSLVEPFMPTGVFADLVVDQRITYPTRKSYFDGPTGYCRLSVLEQRKTAIEAAAEEKILSRLQPKLEAYDAVLVYDRGQGLLSAKIKDLLAQKAKFLGLCLDGEERGHLQIRAQAYGGLDLLVVPQAQLPHKNLSPYLSAPIWRQDPLIIATGPKGQVLRAQGEEQKELPALVDMQASLAPIELSSTVFALASLCAQAKAPADWQLLISGALATMTRQAASKPFELEKMLFEKFVIALLNR